MEYSKIVAVSGLPGLFELINSKTDGAIVRSLEDKTTKFISSRIHQFSHLESIEVYTTRDNVNLAEIFLAMEKAGAALPPDKDADGVRKYFEKVYPELDFDRVYASDMKKMIKWFDGLQKNRVEIKLPEESAQEEAEITPEEAEPVMEKAPAKKTAAKKSKPVKKEEAEPEKKPAAKKKSAGKK
jgi:hypothetical protein